MMKGGIFWFEIFCNDLVFEESRLLFRTPLSHLSLARGRGQWQRVTPRTIQLFQKFLTDMWLASGL